MQLSVFFIFFSYPGLLFSLQKQPITRTVIRLSNTVLISLFKKINPYKETLKATSGHPKSVVPKETWNPEMNQMGVSVQRQRFGFPCLFWSSACNWDRGHFPSHAAAYRLGFAEKSQTRRSRVGRTQLATVTRNV